MVGFDPNHSRLPAGSLWQVSCWPIGPPSPTMSIAETLLPPGCLRASTEWAALRFLWSAHRATR